MKLKTRQFGRFSVARQFFDGLNTGDGVNLFAGMIVLRAEERFDIGGIEYLAVHEDFRPVRPGEIIPEYVAIFEAGKTAPRWEERQ